MSIIEKSAASISRHWLGVTSHALWFGGIGLVVYGSGLIFQPLRYIVGGAALYWVAILMQKGPRESGS